MTDTRDDGGDAPGPEVGRLENGWCRLTPDVGRALFWQLGGYRGLVTWEVIEQTWGAAWWTRGAPGTVPEAEPCALDLAGLARRTGLALKRLSEAKRDLIADGVLAVTGDGRVELVKRFHQWPGFDARGDVLDYCLDGAGAMGRVRGGPRPAGRRTPRHSGAPEVSPGFPGPDSRKTGTLVPENRELHPGNPGLNPPGDDAVSPGIPGVMVPENREFYSRKSGTNPGPLRKESLEIRERGQFAPTPPDADAPTHVREDPPDDFLAGLESGPDPGPAPPPRANPPRSRPSRLEQAALEQRDGRLKGDHVPDPEALARAWALAEETWPTRDLPYHLNRYARTFPSAWILKAVKRTVVKGARNPTPQWFLTILGDWEALGAPDPGPEDRFDDRMVRLTPTQIVARRIPDPYGRAPAAPPPPAAELSEAAAARYRRAPGDTPPAAPDPSARAAFLAQLAGIAAGKKPDLDPEPGPEPEPQVEP